VITCFVQKHRYDHLTLSLRHAWEAQKSFDGCACEEQEKSDITAEKAEESEKVRKSQKKSEKFV